MKYSEVTIQDVKEFCRIGEDCGEQEERILAAILNAGKQFILSQTGLAAEACDEKEDLSIALLLVCSDLYDNRAYSMEAAIVNPAADAILSQYCMNILGTGKL